VLADALEQTRAGARAAEQPRTGADQGAGAA